MIAASLAHYILNGDYVSLGIFGFPGLGFLGMSFAEKQKKNKKRAQRIRKFSGLFFMAAFAVFIYWLLVGKLNLF